MAEFLCPSGPQTITVGITLPVTGHALQTFP